MSPSDRTEILAVLAGDNDEVVGSRAGQALLSVPQETFVQALTKENAVSALFSYCARNLADKPGIADALVKNANCTPEYLVPVVRFLTPYGIQALLDELDRVSESPALAAALEHSTLLTPVQKQQVQELRAATTPDAVALEQALLAAEIDVSKRQTLLQKLARMTVSQRVQLALKGGSEERRTLIRDSNKVVQRAVLQSPRLTEREVESFAAMANLSDETLRLIATNRKFRKNYVIVRNLMNNPKTPIDVSLHMLPLVNPVDLKALGGNKNIPETLRTMAAKLARQRKELRGGG
ncbi:MAG TPA: hypothetical protein VOA41_04935 [Candidatus Dormibacteraeota bacterium]|nr:hypothetical protein [Candidatus Dormibacteraeota bacterium]